MDRPIIPREVKHSVEYRIDTTLKSRLSDDEKIERLEELFSEKHKFLDEIALRVMAYTLLIECPNGLQSSYD